MTAGRLGPLATPLFLGLVLLGFHLGTDAWIRARPAASRPGPREPEATAEPTAEPKAEPTAEPKAEPKAEAEKTGECPELREDLNCTRECGSEGKCTDNLKCCRDGCGWVCHPPDEKPGSCPKVDLPLTPLGLCRDQCQVDSQCPDQMKCCRNGCGKVSCVTPVF